MSEETRLPAPPTRVPPACGFHVPTIGAGGFRTHP
jgi:hypothetical protein